jgi:predicted RNA binding protein YcfA (HicA-like mRNA interferase family)
LKLPRDVGGEELALLLGKYGYVVTRQTGSHLRLTSNFKGLQHHVTVPKHSPLMVGTLSSIVNEVCSYLKTDRRSLTDALFGQK